MKFTASKTVSEDGQDTVTTSKTFNLPAELALLAIAIAGGIIIFGFRPEPWSPLFIIGETLFVAYLVAAVFQIILSFRARRREQQPTN